MKVKHIIYLFILFPAICMAKSFSAKLSQNEITSSDSVILTLTLSDAQAKSEPDIEFLNDYFNIISKQTASSIQMIQWKKSSTVSWQYTLLPKKQGDLIIPGFNIQTTSGTLTTEDVHLSVKPSLNTTKTSKSSKANKAEPSSPITLNINIIKPEDRFYINQPIIFDLEIQDHKPTSNLQLDSSKSSNYSLEKIDGPNVVVKADKNGNSRQVTNIRYLMIPASKGKITFPTFTINGYDLSSTSDLNDPFMAFNSRGIFGSSFDNMKPFAASSPVFDVQISDYESESFESWLPAENITVTSEINHPEKVVIGEPITVTIEIKGIGALANSLPLSPLLSSTENYKVYSDKPIQTQTYKSGNIESIIKHTYSIIPTTTGTLTVPEISVPWWSTIEHKQMNAKTSLQTLNVIPASIINEPVITDNPSIEANKFVDSNIQPLSLTQKLLIAILSALGLLIILVITLIFKRPQKLIKDIKPEPPINLDINNVSDIKQLSSYLQVYLCTNYHVDLNTALALIPNKLQGKYSNIDDLINVISDINSSMFSNNQHNIEDIKNRVISILDKIKPITEPEVPIKLNPC